MFVLILVVSCVLFVFMLLLLFSSKIRAKFMGKQVKAVKYLLDDNKDTLKKISNASVDISKEAIERTARAVKTGLTQGEKIFCKYCGAEIDEDSKFCNKCGKEQ